jgi:alpha-L-rhamnosidase
MWHAARAQYSRQLRYDSRIPKIMQQKAFSQLRNQTSSDSTRIDTVPNLKADRNGLWSTMLPLSEIHSRVMHLNYVLCNQSEDSCELPDRVEGIAEDLLDWHHRLPQHLRYLPANIARYKEYKLFREFSVLHILYHFQFQLLYYQYLQKDIKADTAPTTATARDREAYAVRCKAHAIAMSDIFWEANSQKGTKIFWSPVNSHLLIIASSIHLHTLHFDPNEARTATIKKLLEQNFTMLL